MANCDNLFNDFNDIIRLSPTYRGNLRRSRNNLRGKVREKFHAKGYEVKFHRQGSFAMDTIITPKDNDYDVDDGIYLLQDEQPRESIETLHRWVVEAAEDHTSVPPTDKNPCVRVFFKAGYHVDLVIYYKPDNDHPRLAHKRDGWITSDPKEFMEWFHGHTKVNGQLRRIVRYFKTWADVLRGEMPSGLIFTILATENYFPHDRDDVAFLESMRRIHDMLKVSFVCFRPTTPHEDLFADYSETRKQYFLDRLDRFICSGDEAMHEPNQKEACKKWKRHFGDRFPCHKAEDQFDEAKQYTRAPFIHTDARSA